MMQTGSIPGGQRVSRPVHRLDDWRQFVLDNDGEPVYGIWLHPDEYQEPIVFELPS